MQLYPYQQEAVDRVSASATPTYLAFDMGLGKSAIALAVAKKRGVKRLLILCPAIGKLVWAKEVAKWWGPATKVFVVDDPKTLYMGGGGIFILSYSRVSMDPLFADVVAGGEPFEMTVLDEAHALKNPVANRTKGVLNMMLPKLGFVLPMSGTPTPNHAGELFPILRRVFPETVRKDDGKLMRQSEFEDTYCKVVNRWFGGRSVRTIEGSKNVEALRQRIGPHFMRKTKKDALPDLPDMTFDTYPIPAPSAPSWGIDFSGMSDEEVEDYMTRPEAHVMRNRHLTGLAKVPGAIEAVSDMLDNCHRKALAFAHHKDVIDGLAHGLGAYCPVKITGETTPKERNRAIDGFLTNPACRVFVGNITAAGTSITLVGDRNEVSDVFFVEADYSPGNNIQAASRIHRIGQKDAVQVWFLTAHGTIDDRIGEILARKTNDFHELFK
jgi:SWI/SNF-related matrix-associated actin-dependent regulator 1 of chromatin subfamily A